MYLHPTMSKQLADVRVDELRKDARYRRITQRRVTPRPARHSR
jgi:hypothetical protein